MDLQYTYWMKAVPASEPLEGIFIIDSSGLAADTSAYPEKPDLIHYIAEFIEALYRVFHIVAMAIVDPMLKSDTIGGAVHMAQRAIADRAEELYGPWPRPIDWPIVYRNQAKAHWLVIVAIVNDPIQKKYYHFREGVSKAISTPSMNAAVIIHKQVQEALALIAEKVLVVYGGSAQNHGYIRYGTAQKYDAHVAAVIGHLRRLGCFAVRGRRHGITFAMRGLATWQVPGAIKSSAIGPAMANLGYWAYLVSTTSHRAYNLRYLRMSKL